MVVDVLIESLMLSVVVVFVVIISVKWINGGVVVILSPPITIWRKSDYQLIKH